MFTKLNEIKDSLEKDSLLQLTLVQTNAYKTNFYKRNQENYQGATSHDTLGSETFYKEIPQAFRTKESQHSCFRA